MILLFDTSTPMATAAVGVDDRVLARAECEVTTHSEGLLQLIDSVLDRASVTLDALSAIACGRGPGSYTGLRIGLSTAKGLCFASGRPLIMVSSLLGPALAAHAVDPATRVVTVLDARRGEVFVGIFDRDNVACDELVCRPEAIDEVVPADQPLLLAGDGARRYEQLLLQKLPKARLAPATCHAVQAAHLLVAATRDQRAGRFADVAGAVPTYLRAPDIRPSSAPSAPALAESPPQAEAVPTGDDAAAGKPDAAMIERLRQSGLTLDREGRWWHQGEIVSHQGLANAFHRWLDRLDDGRFIIRLDEKRYAYVDVEDAPYVVRVLSLSRDAIVLQLSDGSRESLCADTLAAGADDALYCRVKDGRFEARFSRTAHFRLAELVVETAEGFALRWAGQDYPIGERQ